MPTIVVILAATAVAASGCGSSSSTDSTGETGGTDGTGETGGTALEESLSRFRADESTRSYVEFGNASRIDELSGGTVDGTWGSLAGLGSGALFQHRTELPDELAIHPSEAESAITTGQPPAALTLLQGGQDGDEITSAANDAGWTGDDVLTLDDLGTNPLAVTIPQIVPLAEDVAVGSAEADMSIVDTDGDTLAADPLVSELASCLGDVVGAGFAAAGDYPTSYGVRPDEDDPDTVIGIICVAPPSGEAERLASDIEDAIASGEIPGSGQPYADHFVQPDVEVLAGDSLENGDVNDEVVRVAVTQTEDSFAIELFQLAAANELPGLESRLALN
ncbi:hypothetical protein EF847_18615 [Actinobacteria bacterium YIM 96077]|uniref:Uncharacterized protein n=1 Tax=Phytoactinopolyspora halophila TaxID=1981511 RepID=A0A329QI23_9ACTN|nr:hypothetical protein EF847_18615 [Actinobacteria bacterium YIM 96077]RAW11876.1 hypothetical protein DPM12_15505 [Phytoactinopolyspora halophila]